MITKTDIEKYFIAEKQAGLFLLVIAIIALLIAFIGFFFLKTNIWKGMAIPFFLIGIMEATVGYNVYKKSDDQRIANVYAVDMNPGKLITEEIPRMQNVKKNFAVILWVEAVALLAGILMITIFKSDINKQLLFGLGLGLAIHAAIALGFDLVANSRAAAYEKNLQTLQKL